MNYKIKVNCKKFENANGVVRYALSTKLTKVDGTTEYVPVYFTKNARKVIEDTKVKINRPFTLTIDSRIFNVLPENENFKKRAMVDYNPMYKFNIDFIKSDWTPAEKIPTLNETFIFDTEDDANGTVCCPDAAKETKVAQDLPF